MHLFKKATLLSALSLALVACQNDHATESTPNETSNQPSSEESITDLEANAGFLFEQYEEKYNEVLLVTEQPLTGDETMQLTETEKHFELSDGLLNELYGVIRDHISAEEFAALRDEQRAWITERDDYATSIATREADSDLSYDIIFKSAQTNYTLSRIEEFIYGWVVHF